MRITQLFFKRYKINSPHSDLSCDPFFIIGSGRNGSTLLAAMLNKHSGILIPPEQFVLHEMIIKFKLYNIIEWKDLVNIILGLIANVKSNAGWQTDFQILYPALYELPPEKRTLRNLIDEIYSFHGREKSKKFEIWGEKSPVNTENLQYIYPVFPTSKYIFLIRDGRDVVSSISKVREKNIDFGVWKWNNSIKQFDWLKKRINPSLLHIVKYEDIMKSTVDTLSNLLRFLGFEFEDKVLKYKDEIEYLGVDSMNHHANLKKDLSTENIGKWKSRLSESEIQKILPSIEKNLERFGYNL